MNYVKPNDKDELSIKTEHKKVKKLNYFPLPKYCCNCYCTVTPLWRKDMNGNYVYNACGLYFKFNKRIKPIDHNKKKNNYLSVKQQMLEHLAVEVLVQLKAMKRMHKCK